MKRVVIIDDHPMVASALADALSSRKLAKAQVISPKETHAASLALEVEPDLYLLDIDLGSQGQVGMTLLRRLQEAGLRVAMVTGSTDEVALGQCIQLGAVGVVAKARPFTSVVDQIAMLLEGRQCNSDRDLLHWVLTAQAHDEKHKRLMRPFETLTERERIVLQHLVDGAVVHEIAELDFVHVTTIRSQVRSILTKLGVQSQLAAVAVARKAKWAPDQDAN